MRTHTIDNTTIEYPDQIGFCFNPVIINILGGNYQSVTATVTDTTTATSDRENRADGIAFINNLCCNCAKSQFSIIGFF